jgi:hypothetical protein
MVQDAIPEIDGAADVADWFGRWPRFHDCEVIGIDLKRHGVSRLHIHAFVSAPSKTNPKQFDRGKDALVTFNFVEILLLDLDAEDFHVQNVISSLNVTKSAATTTVAWNASYGLAGRIEARKIWVSLVGGIPSE